MDRIKSLETSLVLTIAFLLIYFVTRNELFLYISFALGFTGIFIKPLAKTMAVLWFKLANILNYFVSKFIFGTLYFVVLVPVSVLYRAFNKDGLKLRNSPKSIWYKRDHTYSATDFENIW
jgi:hypothetical protein